MKPAPPVMSVGLRHLVDRGLPLEPGRQFGHAVVQRHLGFIAEDAPGLGYVGEAVADVADPVLADDLGGDVVAAHDARQPRGDGLHRLRTSAADVEHLARGLRRLQREAAAASDVVHADEVALLQSILEDLRCAAIEQARSEDRQHARIRIGKRLSRTVGVEETQGNGGDVVCTTRHEAHPFLVELR